MESLGKRIAERRKKKSLTQDQLAEALGVSSQAVSKWENDISCPDISLLPKLSDILGISIDALLRGEQTELVRYEPESGEVTMTNKILKVRILDGETRMSMNIPLALLQLGIMDESGMKIGGLNLKGVDFHAVMEMASRGVIGEILELDDEDGAHCEFYVE